MQLLLAAQLPRKLGGLGGSAVYISTESRLPQPRLQQLALEHPTLHAHFKSDGENDPCKHLLLKSAHTPDELGFVLNQLPLLLAQEQHSPHPIRLVVVDSIAFHFRHDFDDMALRTRLLNGMAQTFIQLAVTHKLAVSNIKSVKLKVLQ